MLTGSTTLVKRTVHKKSFLSVKLKSTESFLILIEFKSMEEIKAFAVGRIRTYAPRGNLISSQTP